MYNTVDKQIACGNFGVLRGVNLKTNTCTIWAFRFGSGIVSNYGSDLGGGVSCDAWVSSSTVK